jgi:hypothetical protein
MTQTNKPEWFEITDADEKPELRKVSKSLPVSAVLVTALILGVGAVTAQTQGVRPNSALNPDTNPTSIAAAEVGTIASNKLANPSISKIPTGGVDDDEDDVDDDDVDDDEGDDD